MSGLRGQGLSAVYGETIGSVGFVKDFPGVMKSHFQVSRKVRRDNVRCGHGVRGRNGPGFLPRQVCINGIVARMFNGGDTQAAGFVDGWRTITR